MILVLAVAALAALLPATPAASAPTPAEAQALAREAYVYGFPLLEFLRVRRTETSVRCPDGKGNGPINTFSNAKSFATPADRTVVAPNVDTLYSIAQLDLGKGPIVLSHPDMGSRYFVFELLDPYTNVVGYVGTRTTGSDAGRFAITWTRGPASARKRIPGTTRFKSKYRRLWVIGRTLASDKADQKVAYKLMKRYSLSQPGGGKRKLRSCQPGSPVEAKTPTGLAFLDALGKALAQNPPPARDKDILDRLATAGIGPGMYPTREGLPADVLDALGAGVDAEAAALPARARGNALVQAQANGGWLVLNSRVGAYGKDYELRAVVATVGLGANTQDEAIYPVGLTDPSGALFSSARRYRLTFTKDQIPPARAFWSLTMYDFSGYLVPNAANRYAIGDSHPPLVKRSDGSVVVAIQRDKPTESDVNWLPTPASGGFRLNLRLYEPEPSALNGTWKPPPVEPLP